MEIIFIIGVTIIYLIYKIGFEAPKNLKRIENQIDTLNLNVKEIEYRLIQIQDTLEEKK